MMPELPLARLQQCMLLLLVDNYSSLNAHYRKYSPFHGCNASRSECLNCINRIRHNITEAGRQTICRCRFAGGFLHPWNRLSASKQARKDALLPCVLACAGNGAGAGIAKRFRAVSALLLPLPIGGAA